MVVTKHKNGVWENPDGGTNHRSDPNNQADDERQIQSLWVISLLWEAQQTQGEGLGILRGVGGQEAQETGGAGARGLGNTGRRLPENTKKEIK